MKFIVFLTTLVFSQVLLAQYSSTDELRRYIMNPAMVQENQEPAHTPLVIFDAADAALTGERSLSPWQITLDGIWKFRWDKNPLQAPEDFFSEGFDSSSWDDIVVPGTWQMQGFGHALYRNIPLEFSPYDPPMVPLDFNPTGSYTRNFELPQDWDGRKIFLHFEGVKTCFWVWINGKYAGFNKDAMTSAEFDITGMVRPGTNSIAVRVIRWADATYLENQDMWKFHGIYRSVYLFSTPGVHVRDFFVHTSFDERYENADLNISAEIKNYASSNQGTLSLKASLFDEDGVLVKTAAGSLNDLTAGSQRELPLRISVQRPKQWSAEKPNLYTLILELKNATGETLAYYHQAVGFRQVDIRDGKLLINGVPVKLKGVNRHEHSPYTGRTIAADEIEKELIMMKQLNINAIRTSHYPNTPAFYRLTDKYGFYVCDEVNAECHQGENFLVGVPGWEVPMLDRMEKMVQRDKNHPSIIMWSTGNECGLALVHSEMAALARNIDSTRVITHQSNEPNGDAPFADILGSRYPTPAQLAAIGDTTARPVIMGEYSHAMGNALGHFDEYWEVINGNDCLQGGFIWDWMDQGVYCDLISTPDLSGHSHLAILKGRPEKVAGKEGNALALSGLDDFIEISPSPSLAFSGPFTLETWIYPRGFLNQNNLLAMGYAVDLVQDTPGSVLFSISTAQGKQELKAALPADWNDNWHHIAAVYDGARMQLLIDGKPVSEKAAKGTIERTRSPFTIGKNHIVNNEAWAGFISNSIFQDVRVHDVAREPQQLGYYNLTPPADDHLLLWLPLNHTDTIGSYYAYGSTPVSGSGSMDGIIAYNRKPEPEAWQVKHSHSPVFVSFDEHQPELITIHNRHHFTNMNELETRWSLYLNGHAIQNGILSLNTPPLRNEQLLIPLSPVEAGEGDFLILTVSSHLKEDAPWASKGYEVAFGERVLREPRLHSIAGDGSNLAGVLASQGISTGKAPDKNLSPPTVTKTGELIVVAGSGFRYTFHTPTGTLSAMTFGDKELIQSGPVLHVTRPPILNELSWWGVAEYDILYRYGLDKLQHEVKRYSMEASAEGHAEIVFYINSYALGYRDIFFENRYAYTVFSTGMIRLDHTVNCHTELPGWPRRHVEWLQRVGLSWQLPSEAASIGWLGKGPFETYPDRKSGAKTAYYSMPLQDINLPYILPQDFDNRTDVRWIRISDSDGAGLVFFSDHLMNISINPYENLENAWYPYQLKRAEYPLLNVDHRVTGVGGTPVTARENYRTYPHGYHYSLYIMPVTD